MFCGECGTKNEKSAQFCENCGAKMEAKKIATEVKEKQPMSKKTKNILIIVSTLAVIVIGVCIFLGTLASPKNIAEKLFNATTNYDFEAMYGFLDVEKSDFTSKEMFKNIMSKQVEDEKKPEIINYTVSDPVLSTDQMTATVTITYLEKDETDSNTFEVKLVKSKDKKWLFFDNWKVVMNGMDMAHDFEIQVAKGSKVTVEGIEIGEQYLNKESSNEQLDVYKMPTMFEARYGIKIELPMGITKEERVKVRDKSYYKYNLSLSDLTEEQKSKFTSISKTNLETLYNGVKDQKTFDDIKSSFEYEGANLSDLKSDYESLVKNIGTSLTAINFTEVTLNDISIKSNGNIELYLKAKYSYTVSYQSSDETKTHDSNDYDYLYLTYSYVNGEYKLVDTSSLNTYFSKYF